VKVEVEEKISLEFYGYQDNGFANNFCEKYDK